MASVSISAQGGVVYYRLPHATLYHRLVQHSAPRSLQRLEDLPLTGGYVIMPFRLSEESPLVVIEPELHEQLPLPRPEASKPLQLQTNEAESRRAYGDSFRAAHRRLLEGKLQKVVLSRRLEVELPHALCGFDLFVRACRARPDCFVAFWQTSQTGSWLVATPEPLLEGEAGGETYHSVALAGTLPLQPGEAPQWNAKNREEQAVVERFIDEQLRAVSREVRASSTYTRRAGNIQHLCTDFHFRLSRPEEMRRVLVRLHPTPAVGGLPRPEALEAILAVESSPRRYYAGFSGPLNLEGETRLYVTLRCMAFDARHATLYAGGGLMPESEEEEEWEETQRKLRAMKDILGGL